ncbi:hypothetical protein LIER_26911 [Lithospermum erythrorhizon]|uniref:CRAL-TRIO domain-containing protein n=1 Tax=Lithospermum erythrorhizon TaxID=34254 RepID=A0AAV3RDH3_LITER
MEKDKKILVPDNNSNSIHIMKEKNKGSAEKCNQEDTIISSHESEKIRHMRAQVEKQEPSSKDVDDLTMRRFLRARDLDIDKASTMFLKYFKWRQTFVPNGSFSKSEVPNEIAHNKVFIQGEDKQGRPIAVLYGGRHIQNKIGGVDELRRFVVFALDRLCSRIPQGKEKFMAIIDLGGWGYSNSDVRGYLAALSILQDYYPERLGKVFMVHVPYIFMTVWKVIYPFIDNNTKKKIVFVDDKRLRSTLIEAIDESQLPDVYGGKMSLIPVHN